MFLQFSTHVPFGHHGDVQNILSIINFSIRAPLSQIFHLPVFYPESFMLTHTHPLFGVSFFFKCFHILGLNLLQSCNLYIILVLILGAFGCYLLSGEFTKSRLIPLLFSSMYIIHHWNLTHFTWLNFLSRFYLPFVLFFLIRFLKTKKKRYILWASFSAFLQFSASIYYGVNLWLFLLPAFLFFALLLKLLSFKELGIVAAVFGLALVLIFFLFYPFYSTSVAKSESPKAFDWELVNSADLFSYSNIFKIWLDYPEKPALKLFPGFAFLLFVLFFFVSVLGKGILKKVYLVILGSITVILTYLAYVNSELLEFIFIVFMTT